MRAPAVSFANKLFAAFVAVLLMFTLVPTAAFAEGEGDAGVSAEETQDVNSNQADEAAEANAPEGAEPDTAVSAPLASVLAGAPTVFVNADVALDGEPIIGSFTVDGMTFAVVDGATVELVGASESAGASPRRVVASSQGLGAPDVLPDLGSTPAASEAEADSSIFVLPESVAYNNAEYSVASVGAYAFYLSGVTSVELPASVTDVDDRAFRSSDVASAEVAEGNPNYSSFDGALYDANQSSLLLIPEGKQGTVLLPSTAETASPSVFSHCPLVQAISVEEGSAAFASENGLLYDASLTTLLRVPAGAIDITIRDGCTTIAAGALEACASLAIINAPASVTSISPDVFTSVPTVSLPALAATGDADDASQAEGVPQLTAMVALSFTDDDLPEVDPAVICTNVQSSETAVIWESIGMVFRSTHEDIALQSASTYGASWVVTLYSNGGTLTCTNGTTGAVVWTSANDSYAVTCHTNYSFYGGGLLQYHPVSGSSLLYNVSAKREGYTPDGWKGTYTLSRTQNALGVTGTAAETIQWAPNQYTIAFETGVDAIEVASLEATYDQDVTLPLPDDRPGYRFLGWNSEADGSGVSFPADMIITRPNLVTSGTVVLHAQWKRADCDLGFDTSSEPGDDDYPGVEKPNETIAGDQIEAGDKVEIEDPKRPGYVFQGWVIPSEDGTTAIDQDLVYQDEADGKWYVDASKLPDYADDSGRVELTARWTSVISVDVPSAATFYYDLVTDQSGEAHEAALAGTTSFSSQSQVDLRVCGLESVKASGADVLFSNGADSALLSVYPAVDGSATTVEDAQGPAGEKPSTAVDFALDDIVLEAAFAKAGADAFSIPAGDDLTLSYRLNLGDGASLDYDKVLAMAEGDETSLASITYTFAADYDAYCFWTTDDDGKTLGVFDIKADAEAIAQGDEATIAKYTAWMNADHRFYVKWYDQGVYELEGGLTENRYTTYEVRIIGLNHDDKADGSSKAGITFQFVQCLNNRYRGAAAIAEGWVTSELRANMNPDSITEGVAVSGTDTDAIWNQLPIGLQVSIEAVEKPSFKVSGATYYDIQLQDDILFLPSVREVFPRRGSSAAAGQAVYDTYYDAMYAKEGTTYAFYAALNPYYISSGLTASYNPSLYKTSSGSGCSYWYRTTDPNPSDRSRFELLTYKNTALWAAKCTIAQGVSPAFCL